jgi:hypothetical protein
MIRTEISSVFDPELHPIGYALAAESSAAGRLLNLTAEDLAMTICARLLSAEPPTPDLFGWELDTPPEVGETQLE